MAKQTCKINCPCCGAPNDVYPQDLSSEEFRCSICKNIFNIPEDSWCKTGNFQMPEVDKLTKTNSYRGETGCLTDLRLHYQKTWHLWHLVGNCVLAATDNVVVGDQYNFLVISKDCVCIYQDTFTDNELMLNLLCCWEYGDNPTVLMNYIDDYMGGTNYWNTGKLFDDIMTIAKSNKIY